MADPNQLSRQEGYPVHQIHPAKLATNVSVSVVSTMLFWQPRLVPGLLVFTVRSRLLPPLSMQPIRSLSAVTIAVGGWRRSPALIVAGAALVGHGRRGSAPGLCGAPR